MHVYNKLIRRYFSYGIETRKACNGGGGKDPGNADSLMQGTCVISRLEFIYIFLFRIHLCSVQIDKGTRPILFPFSLYNDRSKSQAMSTVIVTVAKACCVWTNVY